MAFKCVKRQLRLLHNEECKLRPKKKKNELPLFTFQASRNPCLVTHEELTSTALTTCKGQCLAELRCPD